MLPVEEHIISNQFCEELYGSLQDQLKNIASENDNAIQISERSIETTRKALEELQNYILQYNFRDVYEEILFFKFVKPKFYSHLIYYLKVLRIESRRPLGSHKTEETYFQRELHRLTDYFDNNLDFYQYYRRGATYLDDKYFLRGKSDNYLFLNEHYISSDPRFTTTHDHKVAKILAHELLRIYLNTALEELQHRENGTKPATSDKADLQWTSSKAALIELLYALQSSGVFNNSSADIKQVATFLQKAFHIDLGNYYRTFQEIRIRKKNRTQFLDQLRENLIKRMDETDENPR